VHEVLLRDELLTRLGSRRALSRALSEGGYRRVLRGTYVRRDTPDDLAVRVQAAHRLLPSECWVADRCLLWLLGVDVLPPGPPRLEVVVPRGAVVPRRHGLRAREAAVPQRDRHELHPYEVPSLRPVRAVADLLRLLPHVEAVVVADAVRRARLVTAEELTTELAAHTRLRGVRRAAEALRRSDGLAESPPETRLRLMLQDAGLGPVAQHEVRDSRGLLVARVDLALVEARIAIEYDGRVVHERDDAFVRDRRRQNALVRAGWTVLRFTADDLHRPSSVVAAVRACLAAAA
jgi:very-short-patch-repair endonuclease